MGFQINACEIALSANQIEMERFRADQIAISRTLKTHFPKKWRNSRFRKVKNAISHTLAYNLSLQMTVPYFLGPNLGSSDREKWKTGFTEMWGLFLRSLKMESSTRIERIFCFLFYVARANNRDNINRFSCWGHYII